MMIDVSQAHDILFANVEPGQRVEIPLGEALYRTLAEAVRCDVDDPPFDRSAMDGFAVRAADVAAAPVTLRVAGQIAAGQESYPSLLPGEAIQINTGAPIPAGADAVVRVENTEVIEDGTSVVIRETVPVGRFITSQAAYRAAGQVVLKTGTRLTPLEIAAATTAGADRVLVYRRPTVAILTTGNELVDIGCRPRGAQIRDSNRLFLQTLVTAAQAEAITLGVARDDRSDLRSKIEQGLHADVLCVTGGVSMGAFDFVPEVLQSCGARFHIHKLAVKPGRPTLFATMPDGTLIFALPGNPGGVLVGFVLLVKPALAVLEGRTGELPFSVPATLRGSLQPTAARRSYYPAHLQVTKEGAWIVKPLRWHGSGDSFGLATAGALIMRPPHSPAVDSGETVSALLLDWISARSGDDDLSQPRMDGD